MTEPMPEWATDPELLEQVFNAAVRDGDAAGVEHALRLLAACDPHRAQRLCDDLKAVLKIAASILGVAP